MNTILSILSAIFFSSGSTTAVNDSNLTVTNHLDTAKVVQNVKAAQNVKAVQTTKTVQASLNNNDQTQAIAKAIYNNHQNLINVDYQMRQLSQKAPQLNKTVLKLALTAYTKATQHGDVKKPLLTVIDYSLPSSKQRMWIFDLSQEKLLYNTYVAHGRNSGMDVPHHFSNKNSSKESSLGTYVTRDTYMGSKGLSLNLQGLEHGFNDNALARRVVIHGAWYVEPDFIKKTGRAGRSWGCPSIAKTLAKPVINTIKGGSVVFAYYPDSYYLSHSGYAMA